MNIDAEEVEKQFRYYKSVSRENKWKEITNEIKKQNPDTCFKVVVNCANIECRNCIFDVNRYLPVDNMTKTLKVLKDNPEIILTVELF
tara:strand:- start:22 stop:285 length:264 start_codon:yes stop_codon:yes gene_type:complete